MARALAAAARAGERADLAREIAGAMRAQDLSAPNGGSACLDRAGQNDEHGRVPLAFGVENVVRFQLASLTISLQDRQLSIVERGIHLMVSAAA
ncbi:hypothetical protein GGD41_001664 [Paraburkholderia bryophila]|uniref:Uncharacterized protein n=1 Tax=Paraburkholderia bryophila TaxID=420952 RepID=A0A7Z0AYB9_9BURK|nr:hypothetical protein [Paraburkholderia bryophila]